ncbi:efflux RND transporter periplasmic adaptor subunit [Bacteroidales bacterium OttesenSCG-928-J19]|nr:efflux RND transporter periplasmic adaptor subunit [Bacteroidales bacterium OttesenSCG-928-J19]
MKYILSICIVVAMLISCTHKHEHSHDQESAHVHGADCNHNHDHEHNHDHDHESTHQHGEDCSHDHEHEHEHVGHDHDHTGAEAAKPAHDHGPDAITFTPEQAAKIDFQVAQPTVAPFGDVIKTTAQILSSQSGEAIVTAKASGTALLAGNLTEGQVVARNQTLFSIKASGTENNLSVRFTEAKSNLEKADAAYRRAYELVKLALVSEQEYQEAKSEYEVAQSVYSTLSESYSGSGQRVNSPQAGYVKQVFVGNGEFVSEGQALVSIVSDKNLQLRAEVAPRYASVLPYIEDAVIKTRNKTYSLSELNGRVLSYARTLSDGNYMLPVVFQVDNHADLLPGSFVEISIRVKSEKEAIILPNTALTEEQGLFFVYVQLCPESYEKRQVMIGASDGLNTQITHGISSDERVVTRGALSVKLAQASGALDPHAGHVH